LPHAIERFDLSQYLRKNIFFYQNMPNLHNRHKSAERKISQKNPEYMLNYSLPCSCSWNLNQTLVEWSLDGPLPKLCPVIPTSNQDGRQAKRGDEILKIKIFFLRYWERSKRSIA
jgi:hypothetical protein